MRQSLFRTFDLTPKEAAALQNRLRKRLPEPSRLAHRLASVA
jgi:endonuclease V-like protein UPF0215 family